MKRITPLLVLALLFTSAAGAAVLAPEAALEKARAWMSGNPVMKPLAGRVAEVAAFPEKGAYQVYVASFASRGYLVLNSDDRLDLVVGFSADSSVDLSDRPDNAFRAMLLRLVAQNAKALEQGRVTAAASSALSAARDEKYGPFLETSWDQNTPYNLYCPVAPQGTGDAYYGYRAPAGCVQVAYAQIMYFHCWPPRGTGSGTYTDNNGACRGTHSADFSDPYDWACMQTAYSYAGLNPAGSVEAVGELLYELGVAVGADYEADGTSAYPIKMPERMVDCFYYDFDTLDAGQFPGDLIPLMEADLRAGFPCMVSIPDHTIVADGLMVSSGVTTYHFNYGWGGENNGWWRADNVAGESARFGVTGIRPSLMAFPASDVVEGVEGKPAGLDWILPKRLENDVARLTIFRQNPASGQWSSFAKTDSLVSRRYEVDQDALDSADDFSKFEVSPTSAYWNWAIDGSMGGNCFYKKDGGSGTCFLTSRDTILAGANTKLYIRCKYLIAGRLSIQVATDRVNFAQIDSLTLLLDPNNDDASTWPVLTYDLGAFAGQFLTLRLAYVPGDKYYTEGGFWIDEIGTLEETNPELKGQPVYSTTLSDLAVGSYTLAAVLTDKGGVDHGMGPAFSLVVSAPETDSDGDGWNDSIETLLGTDPADGIDHFRFWIRNESGAAPILHFSPYSTLCNFAIERSEDLSVWRAVEGVVFVDEPSGRLAALPLPGDKPVFYRVRVTAK